MGTAKDIKASQDIFSVTVMLGLRGIILTICLPWMAWLSWKRRTWIPIAGFVLVLLFETGLAGALKMAVGRSFPYQYKGHKLLDTNHLAFPSGPVPYKHLNPPPNKEGGKRGGGGGG